jgi:hypothetical protein
MKIIAHRGLVYGPDKELENTPEQIELALKEGFDVEVDLWWHPSEEKYYLGHDYAQYECPPSLFMEYVQKVWFHCKNLETIRKIVEDNPYMSHNYRRNAFYHTNEDVVLTTMCDLWSFPGKAFAGSYAVMPEYIPDVKIPEGVAGICTDYAFQYRDLYA